MTPIHLTLAQGAQRFHSELAARVGHHHTSYAAAWLISIAAYAGLTATVELVGARRRSFDRIRPVAQRRLGAGVPLQQAA